MKKHLLKLTFLSLALAAVQGAWAIDFGTENVVRKTTNWTFDNLTAETQYSVYTLINNAYLRSVATGRSFTVKTLDTPETLTFGDGYQCVVNKALYLNNNALYSGEGNALATTNTAGDGVTNGTGMVAINAPVAGTFYAKIKGVTSSKVIRMYFNDGTNVIAATSVSSDGNIQEISYSSTTAGTFFVGGITTGTSYIYALRFVPKQTITATTKWTFDQYNADDYAFQAEAKGLDNFNGLYFHTRKSANYQVKSQTLQCETFTCGSMTFTKSQSYNAITMPGSGAPTISVSDNAWTLNTNDAIAVEVGCAGTLNVAAYDPNGSRSVQFYVKGVAQGTATTFEAKEGKALSQSVDGATTIHLASTGNKGALYILGVEFVPSSASAMHEYVTIGTAGMATFSAPQNYDLPSGLRAYIVSDVTSTQATLTEVTDIPACTGVVLMGEAGNYTLTSKEATTADVSSNKLVANIGAYALPASNGSNYNYTLAADGFKHSNGEGTLAAGKAYLKTNVNVPASARLGLVFDDESTGIENVNRETITNNRYYNLNGQRVVAPTKGLYIHNGKKVMVK